MWRTLIDITDIGYVSLPTEPFLLWSLQHPYACAIQKQITAVTAGQCQPFMVTKIGGKLYKFHMHIRCK